MELKRCPFCGGEATFITTLIYCDLSKRFGVMCRKCKAKTSEVFYTPDEAKDAWNRRESEG